MLLTIELSGSIQCKIFLHQALAAHNQLQLANGQLKSYLLARCKSNPLFLNSALNISLTVVGCDNYTELCSRYRIKSYPTVLVFTPSTINNPMPLIGILDSTQLLAVLTQSEDKHSSLVRTLLATN